MKKSHLTIYQRYEIQIEKDAGNSQAEIAILIRKDMSAVSRELKLNLNSLGR